jgi:hypothetical protein
VKCEVNAKDRGAACVSDAEGSKIIKKELPITPFLNTRSKIKK